MSYSFYKQYGAKGQEECEVWPAGFFRYSSFWIVTRNQQKGFSCLMISNLKFRESVFLKIRRHKTHPEERAQYIFCEYCPGMWTLCLYLGLSEEEQDRGVQSAQPRVGASVSTLCGCRGDQDNIHSEDGAQSGCRLRKAQVPAGGLGIPESYK